MRKVFFRNPEKEWKSLKYEDTFPKWPRTLWRHCCLVLLRFWVSASFLGKVLELNTNLILLGKWPRSSTVVGRTLFACFSSFVCSIAGLQRSTVKLHIVGTASFLNASCRGFKVSPNKPKILLEAVFGKEFCTNNFPTISLPFYDYEG